MSNFKPTKGELIAIYRLEFYKNQKKWKFCKNERVKKDLLKQKLNETYCVEDSPPPAELPAPLNDAFLETDSDDNLKEALHSEPEPPPPKQRWKNSILQLQIDPGIDVEDWAIEEGPTIQTCWEPAVEAVTNYEQQWGERGEGRGDWGGPQVYTSEPCVSNGQRSRLPVFAGWPATNQHTTQHNQHTTQHNQQNMLQHVLQNADRAGQKGTHRQNVAEILRQHIEQNMGQNGHDLSQNVGQDGRNVEFRQNLGQNQPNLRQNGHNLNQNVGQDGLNVGPKFRQNIGQNFELNMNQNVGQTGQNLRQNVGLSAQNGQNFRQNIGQIGPNFELNVRSNIIQNLVYPTQDEVHPGQNVHLGQNTGHMGESGGVVVQNGRHANYMGQNGGQMGHNGGQVGQNGGQMGQNGGQMGQNDGQLGQNLLLGQNGGHIGQTFGDIGQECSQKMQQSEIMESERMEWETARGMCADDVTAMAGLHKWTTAPPLALYLDPPLPSSRSPPPPPPCDVSVSSGDSAAFTRGAHARPHSSELDLTADPTCQCANMSGSKLAHKSSGWLRSALAAHTAAAQTLIHELTLREMHYKQSREVSRDMTSESVPTRDIPHAGEHSRDFPGERTAPSPGRGRGRRVLT